jgi:hypothetical protein
MIGRCLEVLADGKEKDGNHESFHDSTPSGAGKKEK